MIMTKLKYILIFLFLFTKVWQTDSCLSMSNNKKIPTRFLKDDIKLPCEGEFSSEWCMNGGTCYVKINKDKLDYHCSCSEHFSGDRCTEDDRRKKEETSSKIPCDEPYKSNFCLNEGTCYAVMFGDHPEYHCECPNSFHGYKCEEKALDGFYGNGLKKD